jgi:hypothetical protein
MKCIFFCASKSNNFDLKYTLTSHSIGKLWDPAGGVNHRIPFKVFVSITYFYFKHLGSELATAGKCNHKLWPNNAVTD